jgi:aspartate carbamoyltransferase catalytic subunit
MITYPSIYKHVISSKQFDKDFLFKVFHLVDEMKKSPEKYTDELKNKIVTTLFYEPSTRTRLSFESATRRLGGSIISTENANETSSSVKGESLEDTIKIISGYSDFIVIRHFDNDSSEIASSVAGVPIINAGSGKTEHPSQAILDTYTIWDKFKRLDNLKIVIAGDLLRGRTCDSLVRSLLCFSNNEFIFITPDNCRVKEELKEELKLKNIKFRECDCLDTNLLDADVVYMTRIQKERFDCEKEYLEATGKINLTRREVLSMKENSIILHPLPRIDEISIEVDSDPRAHYFKQAHNGLWVRMALLKLLNDHKTA